MATTQTGPIELVRQLSSSPVPAEERRSLLAAPGFGRVFTDHMVTVAWDQGRGWHNGRLLPPTGPFPIRTAGSIPSPSAPPLTGRPVPGDGLIQVHKR